MNIWKMFRIPWIRAVQLLPDVGLDLPEGDPRGAERVHQLFAVVEGMSVQRRRQSLLCAARPARRRSEALGVGMPHRKRREASLRRPVQEVAVPSRTGVRR